MATARKGKGGKARGGTRAARHVRDAPLAELGRDQLSVFLYVALLPEETRAIVKELRLGIPGFRSEALGDVERCDVIADEIRANPGAAQPVLAALGKAFGSPPLAGIDLGLEGAADLLSVGGGDAALALSLWRVLSDADAEVRRSAQPLLDDLARHYFGPEGAEPAAGRGAQGPEEEDGEARAARLSAALEDAERRAREAREKGEARVEEVRRKGEERLEKAQAVLREARARESQAVEEAARSRDEAEAARRELARARAELEALRASDAVADAARARAELRDLAGRLGAVEGRLERARERERELEGEVERLRSAGAGLAAAGVPAIPAGAPEEAAPGDDAEGETWLFPVYTREFYDSLQGWDRRIQRAAFKQANLLAQDHRHPSLRALPLEGLPGYYRVRVATDVRLIYRRAERQNEVEILSLIDREDLDRYIRQAKTRG